MYVKDVKTWVENSFEPFVWQRLIIKLLAEFRNEGYYFHTITDDKVLSFKLLNLIDQSLFDLYQENLPKNFLNKQ